MMILWYGLAREKLGDRKGKAGQGRASRAKMQSCTSDRRVLEPPSLLIFQRVNFIYLSTNDLGKSIAARSEPVSTHTPKKRRRKRPHFFLCKPQQFNQPLDHPSPPPHSPKQPRVSNPPARSCSANHCHKPSRKAAGPHPTSHKLSRVFSSAAVLKKTGQVPIAKIKDNKEERSPSHPAEPVYCKPVPLTKKPGEL